MKRTLLFLSLFFAGISVYAQTNHWETAVYETDMWRYVVPTAEPDTNWRKVSFNASSWSTGSGGFGYADGDDNTTTTPNESVFIRIAFSISDTSKISKAILNADYDDGFVAYLNNVEIARASMTTPGVPPYNALATNHEAVMYTGGNPDYFTLAESSLEGLMLPGTNVLAIQIHNVTANSSDLSGRFWLSFGIHDATVMFGPTPNWFVAPVDFTESDLPIFVINTESNTIVDEPKVMADMGIIWNGDGNRNHLTDPFNDYNGKVGVEYRGASSNNMPKRSYSLELWDVNGFDIEDSICGFPSESDWVLSAQYTDKTLMRGMLSFHLIQEMGWYAPRYKPVELVLNGEYKGVYILFEKVKRDNDRVDIAKLQPTDIYGDDVTGGYIVKLDHNAGGPVAGGWNTNYTTWPTGDSMFINFEYPDGAAIMPQQAQYIMSYVDSFETALIGPNYMDSATGYRNYVNINSCVDAFIIQELSRNIDAYRKSYYIYKDKTSDTGKLVMAPIWDYDLTYGNCGFCNGQLYSGWQYNFNYVCSGDYWKNPFWFERMRQDSLFNNQVRCRWEELRGTILNTQYLDTWIDSVAGFMNESQGWNFTVWPIQGVYVWPNYYIGQNYQEEVDTLKWWIHQRLLWMDANIGGSLNGCNITDANAAPPLSPANSAAAYPNPFVNEVTLSIFLPYAETISVSVYNSLGEEILVPIVTDGVQGTNNIQVVLPPDLPAGAYMMRVTSGNKTWTRTLMKSNQ